MKRESQNFIKHYGTKMHSGRYPWGSGDEPYQRTSDFLSNVKELKDKGLSEKEIASGLGLSINEYRNQKSLESAKLKAAKYSEALKLKEKGYSNTAIAKHMGLNESSVRYLLEPAVKQRADILETTKNRLKESLDKTPYLDVGIGVERHMGINRTKLKVALAALENEGYVLHHFDTPQLGTNHKTSLLILTKPGVTHKEVYHNLQNVQPCTSYSEDGGRTYSDIEPIRSVSSKKILVRYREDGGEDRDGLIELRRGIEELSLGDKRYAQVRIGVDGTHYLKGMAMYNDNMPEGVDIIFNTNKSSSTPKLDTFKELKDDPENPFGAIVRQKHYVDANGKKQLSALNIVGYKDESGEEGSWGQWSKVLSSQMLSKQTPALAKKQLELAYDIRKSEYDEIMRLTNPVIKQKLLESFASDADSASVHLKAAALPRQKTHVILPLVSLKDNEIYAPNYDNGEQVVLIRHPHGGIFEIPQLTVNNKNPEGKRLLGNAEDAVGINPTVAKTLSGADFDGDTVLVIPNPPSVGIKTDKPNKDLINFDPKISYPAYEGMPKVGKETGFIRQRQMGSVSNLITDMTIKGADLDEITRAVKHSMVVIDAEKHNLNYKQSYIDNGIAALKQKYQGGANRGASTLISKAKGNYDVPERKDRVWIDPLTGKKVYSYTGESYVNKQTGKTIVKKTKSTQMEEHENAFDLSSGTIIESVYATHANKLKALANLARKESLNTGRLETSPSAKQVYANEVKSLQSKLNIALKNAPLERRALLIANASYNAKKEAHPEMDKDDLKKLKGIELINARTKVGAKKESITITDKEWEAIQSGAVSQTTLKAIMNNTDLDRLKQLATPRTNKTVMTTAKVARAKSLLSTGYTQAEVAKALGVSVSTLINALK